MGFAASRTVFIPMAKDVDASKRRIRPPEAWPSTLCNGDCEILTTAMCAELRKYSQDCIHPSPVARV